MSTKPGQSQTCFEPANGDLNGKMHRLMQDRTATAERLRKVYSRLGGYPSWDAHQLTEILEFRDELSPAQIKIRLTGRELDAALADPRWDVEGAAAPT